MKRVLLLSFLIIVHFPGIVRSQDTDSLERYVKTQADDTTKVYNLVRLYEKYLYSDPQQAEQYNNEAYDLSVSLGFHRGIGTALKQKAILFQYQGKYDSARYYFQMADTEYHKAGARLQHAAIQANIAASYYDQGMYNEALAIIDSTRNIFNRGEENDVSAFLDNTTGSIYLFKGFYHLATEYKIKARDYFYNSGNQARYADAERDLGLIFWSLGEQEKALKTFRETASIYKSLGDDYFLSDVFLNMGNILSEQGMNDSALHYFKLARDVSEKDGYESMLGILEQSVGLVYYDLGNLDQALTYLKKGLKYSEEQDDLDEQLSIHLNLADLFIRKNDFNKAEIHLEEAAKLVERVHSPEQMKNLHNSYYRLYEARGDFEAALREHKLFTDWSDSLFKQQKSIQLAEFEIIYGLEKARQKMIRQETDILLLQKENKIQAQQKGLLAGGMFTFLLGATLVILLLQSRHRKIHLAHLNKERVQQQELEFKKRELASYTLHLAQKNQLLDELREGIEVLQSGSKGNSEFSSLKHKLNYDNQIDRDWEVFKMHFEEVHPDFFRRLQRSYPQLSLNDMRLLALMKLNLNSKEIASILNITPDSVKKSRYRLRKKLELEEEANINLELDKLV